MKRLAEWGPSALLLAAALVLGILAAGSGSPTDDPTPSVKNPGPLGLEVLRTWLEETGHPVHLLEAPLTELPPDLAVLVLAAPTARATSDAEVQAVKAFVSSGGTLVWLVPLDAPGAQRGLREWLEPGRGRPMGELAPDVASDPSGRTVKVLHPFGLARGVDALRVAAGAGLSPEDPAMLDLTARGALWAKRFGGGEVWLAAGPELAQARRLSAEGNLRFWANAAARGPIGFDERHHLPEEGPPGSASIPASFFQLGVLGLAFALVWGRRLGPPRAPAVQVHRSSAEYVEALAALTRKAKVEPELCRELHARLRRLLFERLGIPSTLPDVEAARAAAGRLGAPEGPISALLAHLADPGRATPATFAALARETAALEAAIVTPQVS